MVHETKTCRDCDRVLVFDVDSLAFYKKIGVSIPELCYLCRAQLRLAFRNERFLYKRPCDKCKKDVISMYSVTKPHTVWCHDCWFQDDWSALEYGMDYNPKEPFLAQYKKLLERVPRNSLIFVRSQNSQYTNLSADNRNCYMLVESSNNENCINCYWVQRSKELVDCSFTDQVKLCYEVDDCFDCHNVKWARGCHYCLDSAFLIDCRNCTDCLGCINLRGARYNIFNIQYNKEDYEKILKEFKLDTYSGVEKFKKKFIKFVEKQPRKFAKKTNTTNSSGNYMKNAENCIHCFHCYEAKDCKYGVHVWRTAKDCVDVDTAGRDAELVFNSINAGINVSWQICTSVCWSSNFVNYSIHCSDCDNTFGCAGLRKRRYCILNKQYSKKDYEKLIKKIIDSMKKEGGWGEFFPKDFSDFGYNETVAQEQFPLKKKEALSRGFKWEDAPRGTYGKETINWKKFPDSIIDLPKGFNTAKEIFACVDCKKNFMIIPNEFTFYCRMQIPLPRRCPDCRHLDRMENRGPNRLWHRQCMCELNNHEHKDRCKKEFDTSYSPDSSKIIYCQDCYNREVY